MTFTTQHEGGLEINEIKFYIFLFGRRKHDNKCSKRLITNSGTIFPHLHLVPSSWVNNKSKFIHKSFSSASLRNSISLSLSHSPSPLSFSFPEKDSPPTQNKRQLNKSVNLPRLRLSLARGSLPNGSRGTTPAKDLLHNLGGFVLDRLLSDSSSFNLI